MKRPALPTGPRSAALALATILLIAFGSASSGYADEDEFPPLRPADTSSPRDTLRSFLELSDEAVTEFRARGVTERLEMLLRSAREALDLGATEFGGASIARNERVLLLQDVLARIELPPSERIPGDEEVADGKLTRWTIPDTRIVIARVPSGPRQGEFVFSAETVERLDLDRSRVKHLPVRRKVAPLWEEYLAKPPEFLLRRRRLLQRFKGLDASSPRATLEGFLEAVNKAHGTAVRAEAAVSASPPSMTSDEGQSAERRAFDLLRGAASLLDLSEVAPVRRRNAGVALTLTLKEVLDRIYLPPIEFVPGMGMVERERRPGAPYTWRLPGTEIVIAEVTTGDRAGEFLFSVGTLAAIQRIYEKVQDLPYRETAVTGGYSSPGVSAGFYEWYISTPGRLVPSATFFGRMVEGLPGWLKGRVAGATVWQWIGMVVLALLLSLLFVVLRRVGRRVSERYGVLGRWVRILVPIIMVAAVRGAASFADEDLGLTGGVLATVRTLAQVVVLALTALVAWRIIRAITETTIVVRDLSQRGLDAGLLRLITGIGAFVIAVLIVVAGLRDLGADAAPLVASLGIGGLAIAFAIRPTLENLISGLILYVDRPVRTGDRCTFGGKTGTIESIGIRSTLIRAADRTLISVPNSKFASTEIVNWAACERMLIQTTCELRNETEPDQIRYLLVKLREMFHAHPKIDPSTVRVRFAGFAASGLEVSIRVYALTRDWNEFHAVREDVFLRMADIVKEAGTDFGNPAQTVYMTRDPGLDTERTAAAAAQVEAWRKSGDLPFPRLRAARAAELQGSLDYPPHGSTDGPGPDDDELLAEETPEPLSGSRRKR